MPGPYFLGIRHFRVWNLVWLSGLDSLFISRTRQVSSAACPYRLQEQSGIPDLSSEGEQSRSPRHGLYRDFLLPEHLRNPHATKMRTHSEVQEMDPRRCKHELQIPCRAHRSPRRSTLVSSIGNSGSRPRMLLATRRDARQKNSDIIVVHGVGIIRANSSAETIRDRSPTFQ